MDKKRITRNWIITLVIVFVFSFFIGYYLSYRVNEKERTKLEIIQEIMENEWYYGIDEEDISLTLQEKMILSMLDINKDPYTRYLTSLGSLADSYTGIGLSVSVYGEYFIVSEVSSKTSLQDGVRVGDIIVEINNINVKNKSLDELNTLVFSNNNEVSLKILRDNNELIINTKVTTYDPLTVFTNEYNNNISYLRISEFNLDTAAYIDDYFSNLEASYDKLIIDLRGNPGGYITSVSEVADLFLPSDKIVMSTIDKKGNVSSVKTSDDSFYLFDEIYILINDTSASGAEALAAALDYHLDSIVTLYGDTTYGKGSAQKTINFSDGTYFHYTYALWNTPEGVTINKKGVEAEVSSVNEGISSYSLYESELELYDYGEEVLSIQKILTKLNYYSGPLHSFYDEKLLEAVKAFQTRENLTINGKIDFNTVRYLAKLMYDDKVNYLENELNNVILVISG